MENESHLVAAPSPAHPRETPRARRALLDYLQLGPGRTFQALLQSYHELENPPTLRLGTLYRWSYIYNWSARANRFDDLEAERVQAEYRARREAVMQNGLALDHQRVECLVSLYQRLDAIVKSDAAIWINDVKTLRLEDGSVERVELRRFNGNLIHHLRGLLDDIAAETGGRFSRSRFLGLLEKPSVTMDQVELENLTPSERAEFLRLQDKIFSPPSRGADQSENLE